MCVRGKGGSLPPISFCSTTVCIIQFINQDLRLDLFSNCFYGNILERLFLLSGLSNEVDKLQLQSR